MLPLFEKVKSLSTRRLAALTIAKENRYLEHDSAQAANHKLTSLVFSTGQPPLKRVHHLLSPKSTPLDKTAFPVVIVPVSNIIVSTL